MEESMTRKFVVYELLHHYPVLVLIRINIKSAASTTLAWLTLSTNLIVGLITETPVGHICYYT
jgi:hypothetical protein